MAAMDDEVTTLKGQHISVTVEEALIDVLVVAFQFGAKTFHGALLDITKKNRPYGINCSWFANLGAAAAVPEDPKLDDRLYSLSQRHTYFEQGAPEPTPTTKARRPVSAAKAARDQGVRMRRLRPRQVLCSQCRSICNENSENVQVKATAAIDSKTSPTAQTTLPKSTLTNTDPPVTSVQTPPATPRGVLKKTPVVPPPAKPTEPAPTSTDEYRASTVVQGKMILRKRKLDEEPEELKEHPAPKEHTTPKEPPPKEHPPKETKETPKAPTPPDSPVVDQNPASLTEVRAVATPPVPVLRISFANAEGTVVKIAASCDAGAKAARKALKKAKKEAQRRNVQQNLAPDDSPHRHRKHHKRKRKRRDENEAGDEEAMDDREQDWGCSKAPFIESDLRPAEGLYEEVRNNCLRQKLSISLKRLSARAYARLSPKHGSHHHHHHHHHLHHHSLHDELVSAEDEEDATSDDGSVPDFPRHEPLQPHPQAQATTPPTQSQQGSVCRPLMMRITSQSVNRCVLDGGREMSVGDVVWGKIHGFPWWPGKVLSLTVSRREGGCGGIGGVPVAHQAHVAWFGSSTSSYMPCHQLAPFLRHFKARYNRKKRGPYKEAIRQAQIEAQRSQPQPPLPLPPPLQAEEPLAQQVT